MSRVYLATAAVACLIVAACSPKPAPPAESSVQASESAAVSTIVTGSPLQKYVGKYPSDMVDGSSFLADPLVTAAVSRALPDAKLRVMVLSPATSTPILDTDGKIIAHACEPHNCGDHNWAIVIDKATTNAEVCVYEGRTTPEPPATWYNNGVASQRPAPCTG